MEATVLIKETEMKDNGWFEITDGNGTKFSINSNGKNGSELIDTARGLGGQTVKLTYTEKQNGKFTNRYVNSVEAVTEEQSTNGTYKSDPAKNRSIQRQNALTNGRETAIAYYSIAGEKPSKADFGNTVIGFAELYAKWTATETTEDETTTTETEEDFPF